MASVAEGNGRPTRLRGRALRSEDALSPISFVARGMVARGLWRARPDDPALYPNVPASSGHRADIATYVHYAGHAPGAPGGATLPGWDRPTTRAWFAQLLRAALAVSPAAPARATAGTMAPIP